MIEQLAERFRSSPQRWLIVTGVTFVIALASVLPQVDLLLAERSERAELLAQLSQASATVEKLPEYEKRVAEKRELLKKLRDLGVDEARLAGLRSWIVSTARQSGCQVRRIDFAPPSNRKWTSDDNPLLAEVDKTKKASPTPFQLETRPVSLTVTGSPIEIAELLKTLDADARLKHANGIELRQTSQRGNALQLDLTLWYFALVRPEGVA